MVGVIWPISIAKNKLSFTSLNPSCASSSNCGLRYACLSRLIPKGVGAHERQKENNGSGSAWCISQ